MRLVIADSLLQFQSLKALELKKCRIGRDGILALVDTLSKCTTLQPLDLGSNSIGAIEAAPLFKCVQSHADLLDLVLCANLIGDQGAKALLLHPLTNSHLQSLDLSANGIGDEGAEAISLSLTACTAGLKILKLYVNRISDHNYAWCYCTLILAQTLLQYSGGAPGCQLDWWQRCPCKHWLRVSVTRLNSTS